MVRQKNCVDSREGQPTCRHGFIQTPICYSSNYDAMKVIVPPCCSEELTLRFHPSGKPEQPEECRKDL